MSAASPVESKSHHINESNFNKFNNILVDAKTSIGFWGQRVITLKNNTSYSLNNIIFRIFFQSAYVLFKLYEEKKDTPSTEMRIQGLDLCKKFHHLYEKTDKQIKKCNFLTRFFVWLGEFSFFSPKIVSSNIINSYPPTYKYNFWIKNNLAKSYLSAYTEEDYIKTFGDEHDYVQLGKNIKEVRPEYKYETGRLGKSLLKASYGEGKIVVSEDAIRALKA